MLKYHLSYKVVPRNTFIKLNGLFTVPHTSIKKHTIPTHIFMLKNLQVHRSYALNTKGTDLSCVVLMSVYKRRDYH